MISQLPAYVNELEEHLQMIITAFWRGKMRHKVKTRRSDGSAE